MADTSLEVLVKIANEPPPTLRSVRSKKLSRSVWGAGEPSAPQMFLESHPAPLSALVEALAGRNLLDVLEGALAR